MSRGSGEQALAPVGPGEAESAADVQLRAATYADLPALAELYSEAFESNPSYRWLFSGKPTEPAPPGALPWLFLRRARMLLQRGCTLLVGCGANGELVAAGGLVPFDRKPGQLDFFMNGILLWPLWYGAASLRRALAADGGLAALRASGALEGVAAELAMIAVRPEMQGRGLGGRVMAALLGQWDAGDGRALLLMTQESHALRLYGRHGFKLLDGGHPGARHPAGGYTNWVMLRPSQWQGAAAGEPWVGGYVGPPAVVG